jgi:hypothetical protein
MGLAAHRSESEMGTLRAGVGQPQPSDLQACPHFALLTARQFPWAARLWG